MRPHWTSEAEAGAQTAAARRPAPGAAGRTGPAWPGRRGPESNIASSKVYNYTSKTSYVISKLEMALFTQMQHDLE